jgi:hypothetical protein
VQTRVEFLQGFAGPWKEVANALWDQLDQGDMQFMYADWFERAYNNAAQGDTKTWEAIQQSLFNVLHDELEPLGILSWDDRTWRDMVPFVGGGWMMMRARDFTIREEP